MKHVSRETTPTVPKKKKTCDKLREVLYRTVVTRKTDAFELHSRLDALPFLVVIDLGVVFVFLFPITRSLTGGG